jgi:mannose-6-phosphate isomerase
MLCHQGIGFNNIFEFFNYQNFSRQETLKRWLLKPIISYQSDFAYEEILIDGKRIPYFGMKSILIYNSFSIKSENIFSIIIVISGNGKVIYENKSMVMNKGDKIFLPAGLGKLHFKNISSVQPLHLIRCFPPDSTKKRG